MLTDKAKKVSFFLLPSLVSAIIPIITLPIYSRLFSVDEYGVYALCIAFATFASGLSNMGLATGYERNFFEQKNETEHGQLLFSVVLFVVAVYVLFGLPIYFFKTKLSAWIIGDTENGLNLFLAFCALSVSSLKNYFLIYYRNTGNAKAFAWFSIDEMILNVVSALILVIYLKMGIGGLIIGQLAGAVLVLFLLLIRFSKVLPFGWNKEKMHNCFAISLPLTPKVFFGVIGTQFDKYLIGLLGSLGAVGLYNLGQKIAYMVFNYMTALQNIFSPTVYRMMFEKGNDQEGVIGRYLTFPFFASALGGLCLSIFCEEVIYLLTPAEYHGASDIVSVLCLMYVIYFFGKQPQLVYAKKTGITSWLTLMSIILNITINIPFIKHYGAIGAAYGTLLSAMISVAITLLVSQKYFSIQWEWYKIIYIIFFLFLFCFIHIFLRFLNIDWFYRVPVKIIGIAIYILGAYWFQIFKIHQLKFIFKRSS